MSSSFGRRRGSVPSKATMTLTADGLKGLIRTKIMERTPLGVEEIRYFHHVFGRHPEGLSVPALGAKLHQFGVVLSKPELSAFHASLGPRNKQGNVDLGRLGTTILKDTKVSHPLHDSWFLRGLTGESGALGSSLLGRPGYLGAPATATATSTLKSPLLASSHYRRPQTPRPKTWTVDELQSVLRVKILERGEGCGAFFGLRNGCLTLPLFSRGMVKLGLDAAAPTVSRLFNRLARRGRRLQQQNGKGAGTGKGAVGAGVGGGAGTGKEGGAHPLLPFRAFLEALGGSAYPRNTMAPPPWSQPDFNHPGQKEPPRRQPRPRPQSSRSGESGGSGSRQAREGATKRGKPSVGWTRTKVMTELQAKVLGRGCLSKNVMRHGYQLFGRPHDGVTATTLRRTLAQLGMSLSLADCTTIFRHYDPEGLGTLSFRDFFCRALAVGPRGLPDGPGSSPQSRSGVRPASAAAARRGVGGHQQQRGRLGATSSSTPGGEHGSSSAAAAAPNVRLDVSHPGPSLARMRLQRAAVLDTHLSPKTHHRMPPNTADESPLLVTGQLTTQALDQCDSRFWRRRPQSASAARGAGSRQGGGAGEQGQHTSHVGGQVSTPCSTVRLEIGPAAASGGSGGSTSRRQRPKSATPSSTSRRQQRERSLLGQISSSSSIVGPETRLEIGPTAAATAAAASGGSTSRRRQRPKSATPTSTSRRRAADTNGQLSLTGQGRSRQGLR